MKEVLFISTDYKKRNLEELDENQFQELRSRRGIDLQLQCRRFPDGSTQWCARWMSEQELQKVSEKERQKHLKKVYGSTGPR